MFLGVLQCVYQSLGEGKAKFIECLICEAIFNLEGISTKEGQVTLIQNFTIYKGVSQQYSNNIMTDLTWRLLVRNIYPEDPILKLLLVLAPHPVSYIHHSAPNYPNSLLHC